MNPIRVLLRLRSVPHSRTLPGSALAAFLLLGNVLAQQTPHDWFIVPGVRVGPITASSTVAALEEIFGRRDVITQRISGEIETAERVTLVYRDPSKALGISWVGNGTYRHPETIWFCFGANEGIGAWQTTSGIRCGTTLRQLEALNGRPFTVSGYSGDLQGTVLSWGGGRLDGELGRKGGALEISVAPKDRQWRDRLSDAPRARLKGATLQSNDPTIQELDPAVYRMVFRFAGAQN
jgi:hypothetical protein